MAKAMNGHTERLIRREIKSAEMALEDTRAKLDDAERSVVMRREAVAYYEAKIAALREDLGEPA